MIASIGALAAPAPCAACLERERLLRERRPCAPGAVMSSDRTPLITARNLRLGFGPVPVFEDIDVEISAGEIFCIVGPNGSGKTTLIRVLLGLLKPDSGEVRKKDGLRVGYVPQVFAVDPTLPLTVRRLLRLTQKPSRKEMEAGLAEVGAADLLDCPVGTLSGGERQRVLLARALLRDPELLVLDEPIQNVDMAGQGRTPPPDHADKG